MALSAGERKMWLGHGGLTRVAARLQLTVSHVCQVNRELRLDAKVQRAIAREIVRNNPDISPEQVWPMSA